LGIRKLLKKFGKWVRSGSSPFQIFLGCFLGFFVGMIPGFNLLVVIGVLLLVVLNVSRGLALLGLALGKLLCLLLAPVTFHAGYFIIHRMGLEGFFRAAASAPFTALMDLHVYCVAGGLPFALLLGAFFGYLMSRIITGLRRGILEATRRSEKMERLSKNKLVRFLLWLAFGKAKKVDEAGEKPPLVKKFAAVLCLVAVGLVLLAQFALSGSLVRKSAEKNLGRSVGAEVNIRAAGVSLLTGKLSIDGLQITDPDKPTHNMVAIEKLVGDINIAGLFAKRLIVDRLTVSGFATGTPRKSPGRVFERRKETERKTEKKTENALSNYFEDGEALEKCLGHAEKLKGYLEKFSELKDRAGERKTPERRRAMKQELLKRAQLEKYFLLSAKELIAARPACVVRRLEVEKIRLGEGSAAYSVHAEQISTHPERNSRPMMIRLTGAGGLDASVVLHFEKSDGRHHVRIKVPGVSVGRALKPSSAVPVDVQSATADIEIDGTFSADEIHIPVKIHLTDLKARTRQGRSVLGLDPRTAARIFENLDEFTVAVTLVGSLDEPRVELDEQQTLEQLKAALVKAGKAELASRVNGRLEKLTGGALKGIKPDLSKGLPKNLLPGLSRDEAEKQETKKKRPSSRPENLLKKLF